MASKDPKIKKDDVKKIKKDDVKNLFIIEEQYGTTEPPVYPKDTVVLSTVEIHSTISSPLALLIKNYHTKLTGIHRNQTNHAEIHFFDTLREKIRSPEMKTTKVKTILVQNYSPCRDCAKHILKFIKDEIENQGIEFDLTIQFANFYLHQEKENREGLMKLLNKGVKLELLQGDANWEEFLKNDTFVELKSGDEKAELSEISEMAKSKARKERERIDAKILKMIRNEALDDPNSS